MMNDASGWRAQFEIETAAGRAHVELPLVGWVTGESKGALAVVGMVACPPGWTPGGGAAVQSAEHVAGFRSYIGPGEEHRWEDCPVCDPMVRPMAEAAAERASREGQPRSADEFRMARTIAR
jgi:hypothetical protein